MRTEDWMTVQQKAGGKVAPIHFPGNFLPIRVPFFRLWSSQPIPPTGHDEVGAEPPEPARGWRASLNAFPLLAPPLCSGLGGGASLISQSCPPAVSIRRMHVVVSPLGAAEKKQMRERHIRARTRPTGRLQM